MVSFFKRFRSSSSSAAGQPANKSGNSQKQDKDKSTTHSSPQSHAVPALKQPQKTKPVTNASLLPVSPPQIELELPGRESPPLVDLEGASGTPWVDLGDDHLGGSPSSLGLRRITDSPRLAVPRVKTLLDDIQLTVEQTTALISACSKALHRKDLETLGLFRPWRLAESQYHITRALAVFLKGANPDGPVWPIEEQDLLGFGNHNDPLSVFHALLQDMNIHDVAACIKWGLRHVHYGPGGFSDAPESTQPWRFYTHFVSEEEAKNCPNAAFTELLLPSLPKTHASLLKSVLDLIALVTPHAYKNAMTASHLCRIFGFWLFGCKQKSQSSAEELYQDYLVAGSVLERLFLSYLRSHVSLPVRLEELISIYPPLSGAASQAGIRLITHAEHRLYTLYAIVEMSQIPRTSSRQQLNKGKRRLPTDVLTNALTAEVESEAARQWQDLLQADGETQIKVVEDLFSDEASRVFRVVESRSNRQVTSFYPTSLASPTGSRRRSSSLDVDFGSSFRTEGARLAASPSLWVLSIRTAFKQYELTPLSRSDLHHKLGDAVASSGNPSEQLTWREFADRGFSDPADTSSLSFVSELGRKSLDDAAELDDRPNKLKKPYPILVASRNGHTRFHTDISETIYEHATEHSQTGSTAKISSVKVMEVDSVFTEVYLDSLDDPVICKAWPSFVIADVKKPGPYQAVMVEERMEQRKAVFASHHTKPTERTSVELPRSPTVSSIGSPENKKGSRRSHFSLSRSKKGSNVFSKLGSIGSSVNLRHPHEYGSVPLEADENGRTRVEGPPIPPPIDTSLTSSKLPLPIERPPIPMIIKTSPVTPPRPFVEPTVPQVMGQSLSPTVTTIKPTVVVRKQARVPPPTVDQPLLKRQSSESFEHQKAPSTGSTLPLEMVGVSGPEAVSTQMVIDEGHELDERPKESHDDTETKTLHSMDAGPSSHDRHPKPGTESNYEPNNFNLPTMEALPTEGDSQNTTDILPRWEARGETDTSCPQRQIVDSLEGEKLRDEAKIDSERHNTSDSDILTSSLILNLSQDKNASSNASATVVSTGARSNDGASQDVVEPVEPPIDTKRYTTVNPEVSPIPAVSSLGPAESTPPWTRPAPLATDSRTIAPETATLSDTANVDPILEIASSNGTIPPLYPRHDVDEGSATAASITQFCPSSELEDNGKSSEEVLPAVSQGLATPPRSSSRKPSLVLTPPQSAAGEQSESGSQSPTSSIENRKSTFSKVNKVSPTLKARLSASFGKVRLNAAESGAESTEVHEASSKDMQRNNIAPAPTTFPASSPASPSKRSSKLLVGAKKLLNRQKSDTSVGREEITDARAPSLRSVSSLSPAPSRESLRSGQDSASHDLVNEKQEADSGSGLHASAVETPFDAAPSSVVEENIPIFTAPHAKDLLSKDQVEAETCPSSFDEAARLSNVEIPLDDGRISQRFLQDSQKLGQSPISGFITPQVVSDLPSDLEEKPQRTEELQIAGNVEEHEELASNLTVQEVSENQKASVQGEHEGISDLATEPVQLENQPLPEIIPTSTTDVLGADSGTTVATSIDTVQESPRTPTIMITEQVDGTASLDEAVSHRSADISERPEGEVNRPTEFPAMEEEKALATGTASSS